ncbi:MAG: hypothetical protein K0U15_05875 [Proteobacteria bacterium]|nr:hypothetical protein [Pseudomonadota bacterium]
MTQEQYDWIPFFEAIADGLLRYKNDRKELIDKFHEIAKNKKYQGSETIYHDRYEDGSTGPLKDIAPFTVMGLFLRVRHEKRIYAATELANFLQIDINIPNFFTGVPVLRPDKSWFFAFSSEGRKENDIDILWDVLAKAVNYVNDKNDDTKNKFITAFNEALTVKQVKQSSLTTGLYWARPNHFPPLNDPFSNYINNTFGITVKEEINGEEYLDIIDLLRKIDKSFPEISCDAFPYNKNKTTNVVRELSSTYNEQKSSNNMKTAIPRNQIFYGPPGTGKTYKTIDEAIRIVDGEYPQSNKRNSRFQELKKDGKIELITFHQNYAYEDFIEGIKPKMEEENISYEIKDGIFKGIANRANENREDSKKTSTATNVKELIEQYANDINEQISDEKKIYLDKTGDKKLLSTKLNTLQREIYALFYCLSIIIVRNI